MSERPRATEKQSRTELFDSLTVGRRRRLLRILTDRSESLTERELATSVAQSRQTLSAGSVPEEAIERLHLQLCHVDLPKLAELGLVSWDEDAGTVTLTDHPIREDARFRALLRTDDDQHANVLVDEQCREVLAIVEGRSAPVTRGELARMLASPDPGTESASDVIEAIEIDLHHVRLPKLAQAGLVDYDGEDETVSYSGPQAIRDAVTANNWEAEFPVTNESNNHVKIP